MSDHDPVLRETERRYIHRSLYPDKQKPKLINSLDGHVFFRLVDFIKTEIEKKKQKEENQKKIEERLEERRKEKEEAKEDE